MDDAPAPRPEVPSTAPHRAPSRRSVFLAGAAVAVAAGAGGGVALGLAGRMPSRTITPPLVPHALLAAEQSESQLIAGLDAALPSASTATRAVLRQVRADHVAHLRAVRSAIVLAARPGHRPAALTVHPASGPLAGAEQAASRAGADRATGLTGVDSVLLASIAACEATHAALLT